jgi:hypothetical protein
MERWRDVVGYEGLYQVSDQGKVRSVDRVVSHGRYGAANLKGRILRLMLASRCGHLGLTLYNGGVGQIVKVHRLVAAAWIGPCPVGYEVRHGPNGITNNSVSNLSYGTRSENNYDERRDGTHKGRCVVRSDGKEFISLRVAAEESGCSYQNIWACCKGKRKTTGGYGWAYYDGPVISCQTRQ